MIRGNTLLENISKLNTYVLLTKSNEALKLYLDKILNKQCKSLKYINDYDYVSIDLLYTSLQINSEIITTYDFNKIDKKELKYYLDKAKGINYIKRQVPSIKNEEYLIKYIIKSLSQGEFICNNNNTVKFDNELVLDSDWLIEFSHFIIKSINMNEYLSNDQKTYSFKTIEFPKEKNKNIKNYLKDIKLYEYNVNKKNTILNYQNIEYLINTFKDIKEYDFKKLQEINSKLSKEKYSLSINKINLSFKPKEKMIIEKLYQENDNQKELEEYIKRIYNCYNSEYKINQRYLNENYEYLRALSHAYKCNYSLNECRKLFEDNKLKELNNILCISSFYINYIYDYNNLNKYFNYELLELDKIKPSIIDYETIEYKNILEELSNLNKKAILENRKVNKLLESSRHISKDNQEQQKQNNEKLVICCQELERITEETKILREELNQAKDNNRNKTNINKTKIKYIKEAITNSNYIYDKINKQFIFDCYSSKDYHHTFHLEISLLDFEQILLNEKHQNNRINFYQL